MADLSLLTDLINDAIADTADDPDAADDLQVVLLVGLGLSIAFEAGPDVRRTIALCELAASRVREQATIAATILVQGGRC